MSRGKATIILAGLMLVVAAAPLGRAAWDENGILVCDVASNQQEPDMVTDGRGGVIIAWDDDRSGSTDIYAQRFDVSGTAMWTGGGVPLCLATGGQQGARIVANGSGGAIVTWQDYRGADNDIYAQMVDATGVVMWTSGGVAVSTAAGDQTAPQIIADGFGGAIIVWYDNRGADSDIYAQRLDASGTPLWTSDGVAVCQVAGDQYSPRIISDGYGGAIFIWNDERSGTRNLYAQRAKSSGAMMWATGGVAVCTAAGGQYNTVIISDDAGGGIVAWDDVRSGNFDIYAQRFDDQGTMLWTTDGVPLCSAPGNQTVPVMAKDGSGGAIVAWVDPRDGLYDIYAQHLDASGAVQWVADGLDICPIAEDQMQAAVSSDGAGGAIIAWRDNRDSSQDIYAQQVDGSGVLMWNPPGGVALGRGPGEVSRIGVLARENGGAFFAWRDYDSGIPDYDVYAQLVDHQGRIGYLPPVIHSVADVPGDQGGFVNLTWDAPVLDYMSGDITEYTLWRALTAKRAGEILAGGGVLAADPAQAATVVKSGRKDVLRLATVNGEKYYWELVDTQAAYRLESYAKAVPTLFDSTDVSSDYHYFQVIAHTGDPGVFYVSDPDSGRSVDNLSPAAPINLEGWVQYTPTAMLLTWDPNTEVDLSHYRIYRAASPDFVPGKSTLVTATAATAYVDSGWQASDYYKVSAVDVHGNESTFSLLGPSEVSGVGVPALPVTDYLDQNSPNPFNPETEISFGLARASRVTLGVYDLAGRLVQVVARGDYPAGSHSVRWDGRDASGREVASAVYICRLETETGVLTRRMLLLK